MACTEVKANQGLWNWLRHAFTGKDYYNANGVEVQSNGGSGSVFVDDNGQVYVDGMEDVSVFGSKHDDKILISNSRVKNVDGKNGNDYIEVFNCDVDTMKGGNGNDALVSWNSNVRKMEGQKGKDDLIVSGGHVGVMDGGRGDDYLYTQRGAHVDKMDGGKGWFFGLFDGGNDEFDVNYSSVGEINGRRGNDRIDVNESNVRSIRGGRGRDTVNARFSRIGNVEGEDGFWNSGLIYNLFARDNVYSLDSEIGSYGRVNYKRQSTTPRSYGYGY